VCVCVCVCVCACLFACTRGCIQQEWLGFLEQAEMDPAYCIYTQIYLCWLGLQQSRNVGKTQHVLPPNVEMYIVCQHQHLKCFTEILCFIKFQVPNYLKHFSYSYIKQKQSCTGLNLVFIAASEIEKIHVTNQWGMVVTQMTCVRVWLFISCSPQSHRSWHTIGFHTLCHTLPHFKSNSFQDFYIRTFHLSSWLVWQIFNTKNCSGEQSLQIL
jgi:hypothetical protein